MDDIVITSWAPGSDPVDPVDQAVPAAVAGLLERAGLGLEADVEVWALARRDGRLVGCMGLAGDLVKDVVVDQGLRGHNLMAGLLTELRHQAVARGRTRLSCYTRPSLAAVFASLGFRALAQADGLAVLMEDDPRGVERYQADLAASRREGERIAAVVLNANPFSLGHQHLLRLAARDCDLVHVFVLGEDRSQFSPAERFALVRDGLAALPEHDRFVLHPGSRYIVSRLTFPQYFLKDQADIARAHAGIDLQLFRQRVAPVLGIRHRFVGSEPTSRITAHYNQEMRRWLQSPQADWPTIEVHQVERLEVGGRPVSATRVRQALAAGRFDQLAELVPATTWDYLVRRPPRAEPAPLGPPAPPRRQGGRSQPPDDHRQAKELSC